MQKELPLFNRDLSWISFNQRILEEAARKDIPLLERIRFLAIYSSNLDEFYRVRMPVLLAIKKISQQDDFKAPEVGDIYKQGKQIILRNQAQYGEILREQIIPALEQQNIYWVYQKDLPEETLLLANDYFFSELAAYLEITALKSGADFFPINNRIYCVLTFKELDYPILIHIPEQVPRFYKIKQGEKTFVLFIDDIIRKNISDVFPEKTLLSMYTFKVTRNADLDFSEGFEGDLAQQIESKLRKRDFGLASRLQYQASMPKALLQHIMDACRLRKANTIEGGDYHNMKDLFSFPVSFPSGWYPEHVPLQSPLEIHTSQLQMLQEEDVLISTPYESYHPVMRFFNEAAIDESVEEIYTTIYRVAKYSKILQALMSAVKNGKKVTVFVELRARFDEANNIRWARQLQKAGVHVLYGFAEFKIHAKVALVKGKNASGVFRYALFSTGNLNEQTSEIYADHILLTRRPEMCAELEELFVYLSQRKERGEALTSAFKTLLVAPFNLGSSFLAKIDREIQYAKLGKPAEITIKLNNLEEDVLIAKLYQAAQAGVKVQLIVRSICRLVPGKEGYSENIKVRRIVDRYLEHSRVVVFQNAGAEEVWLGSADWMYRNIHHRIEVCFPILDPKIQKAIKAQLKFQLEDEASAVYLSSDLQNVPVGSWKGVRAQMETYRYLQKARAIKEKNRL